MRDMYIAADSLRIINGAREKQHGFVGQEILTLVISYATSLDLENDLTPRGKVSDAGSTGEKVACRKEGQGTST